MAGLYSDEVIDAVARASNITEVVQSYFPLKRAGKDYTALCPFHPEKTPSFTVSPSKQIFKCFGCGRGGSVFNFVMLKENVTFPEAVRILAERSGIALEEQPEARERVSRRQQLRKVLDWAVRVFEANLRDPDLGRPGREYLESRGFTAASIEAFRIGFAPDGWDRLVAAAAKAGVPPALMDEAGLTGRSRESGERYDRFRNRVIFPITDALGRPIAFGGRTLGDDPAKYLNSPETPLFQKGENVYGLVEAREAIEKERRAVVVEGYTDVVMPHQVGVTNVVATLGTALTAEHVRLLKRYADEVVLVFDSDLAGRRAADRGMELFLAEDVSVRVAVLPEGKDPFDVARDEGAEALRGYLGAARDALEYKWDQVRTEWRANESPAAQRRALEAMLQSLAAMPGFDAATGIRRDMMLGRIARTLGVTEQALRGELSRIRRRPGRTGAGLETPERADVPAARGPRYGAERDLMTALVHFPARFDEIDAALPREGLRAERLRGLYEAIRASGGRRDRDVESLVRSIEDPATSALAVELYERGEAIEASRPESDTGPGPLARMLEEAAGAILDLEENERLAARGRAAREAEDADEALRAFAESRSRRQGFLPPSARRPGGAETA